MQLEFGGRQYPVAAVELVIGSGPESTLVLAAPGVLPRHAIVRLLKPGMAVVAPALPEAEILVNGARLGSDPTPLLHGDKIRVGNREILVVDPSRAGATRSGAAAPSSPGTDWPRSPTAPNAPEPSDSSAARLVSLTDGREYLVTAAPFVIGRDAGSDVVVDEREVSRRHAEILTSSGGNYLVDQSINGVWINGERVRSKALLKSGDVIRVVSEELRYYPAEVTVPPLGAAFRLSDTIVGLQLRRPPPVQPSYLAPSQPALASLLVTSGQRKGDRLSIRTPVVNIGRAEYNDIALPDTCISASHAKLQLREGVWLLADLGSTNGTKVDGEPVVGEAPLSPGALLTLGEVTLAFEPVDKGVAKGSGTVILEVPLAAAAPVGPGPQWIVADGGGRHPIPPRPIPRRRLILIGVVVVILAVTYFLLG